MSSETQKPVSGPEDKQVTDVLWKCLLFPDLLEGELSHETDSLPELYTSLIFILNELADKIPSRISPLTSLEDLFRATNGLIHKLKTPNSNLERTGNLITISSKDLKITIADNRDNNFNISISRTDEGDRIDSFYIKDGQEIYQYTSSKRIEQNAKLNWLNGPVNIYRTTKMTPQGQIEEEYFEYIDSITGEKVARKKVYNEGDALVYIEIEIKEPDKPFYRIIIQEFNGEKSIDSIEIYDPTTGTIGLITPIVTSLRERKAQEDRKIKSPKKTIYFIALTNEINNLSNILATIPLQFFYSNDFTIDFIPLR